MGTKKKKLVRTGRVHKPYQEVEVEGKRYYDYSIRIGGVVFEVSVRLYDGKLYINKDENQGE